MHSIANHISPSFSAWLKIGFLCLCCLGLIPDTTAQTTGFRVPQREKKVEVPFQFHNGFIVIEVLFNQVLPMKFIFDTGAEYTILTKKEAAEAFGVMYNRQYRILGSDMKTELVAYLTRGIRINAKGLEAGPQDILVLEEDYFRLDEFTGVKIQGIIGANLFRHLVFKINYRHRVITFFNPEKFTPKDHEGYTPFDISVHKGKPYLACNLEVLAGKAKRGKLLVDTGASLGLLLHNRSGETLELPENVIAGMVGSGLGGQLSGFMGRITQVKFKEFQFDGFVATFQEISSELDTTFLNGRDGILGNYLLDRFTLIFDYSQQKLYLAPRRNYNKGFHYDRSGLGIVASGQFLNEFVIQNVLEQSPAGLAGLQAGDKILSINRINRRFLNLEQLNRKLQRKVGKKIRLKIWRDGRKQVYTFRLKELI